MESSSWTVADSEAGGRLDKFLAAPERLGSWRRAQDALDRRKVFVNGTEAEQRHAGARLQAGDVVRLWMGRPGSARRVYRPTSAGDVDILVEDDLLLVVNKPAGLLAVPLAERAAPSAYDSIDEHLRGHRRRPRIVHRIDRDTSGLVVFAKTEAAQRALKEQFRRREPERVYLAVVHGRPAPDEGTWRDCLAWDAKTLVQRATHAGDPRGSEAISRYRVLEALGGASLLEVRLETGRQNQIRIQAQLRGHELVGERRYVQEGGERRIAFARQALHAWRLSFRHPGDGRPIGVEAPPPADFRALLARLRSRRK